MNYKSIKTGQTGALTGGLYAVKCDDMKRYATHIGDNGHYYAIYGSRYAFNGAAWVEIR